MTSPSSPEENFAGSATVKSSRCRFQLCLEEIVTLSMPAAGSTNASAFTAMPMISAKTSQSCVTVSCRANTSRSPVMSLTSTARPAKRYGA